MELTVYSVNILYPQIPPLFPREREEGQCQQTAGRRRKRKEHGNNFLKPTDGYFSIPFSSISVLTIDYQVPTITSSKARLYPTSDCPIRGQARRSGQPWLGPDYMKPNHHRVTLLFLLMCHCYTCHNLCLFGFVAQRNADQVANC